MYEFLKKGILLGIGLASVTREKIESTVEELVKRGELSEKDGRNLVEELKKRSEEVRSDLNKRVEKIVADTLEKIGVPGKDEVEDLKQRIENLEQSLKDR